MQFNMLGNKGKEVMDIPKMLMNGTCWDGITLKRSLNTRPAKGIQPPLREFET
jgi:hypothetical protein